MEAPEVRPVILLLRLQRFSKIKVFEITQKTLIKELDKLSQDEDYADIHAWDLKVNRTGLKMNTEYSILPSPRKKGSDDEIKAAWSAAEESGYDLQQLLVGGNPFGGILKLRST